ncbi:MAG TPA: nickel pincer cofactor biosynthesis protein LarC [Candidatus Dormibacteraeota bacterium]|nr:nickel pincer cofactor biosynthesis protein LarC [Candidatus Dormibacteraeota bacterium]
MKLIYFDCFSGISGDMVLGALVDAGCELAAIEAELKSLPISGWKMSAAKVPKKAITATHVHVEISETHHHRNLNTILEIIRKAGLAPRVASRASNIFKRLGESEALMHQVPLDKVHFHEVGAVDAMVDIVGACIGFELLAIEHFVCSPLNVGSGSVQTAHGLLPVPAPATAELLRGAPTYSSGVQRELVTPTGAAIVSTLVREFGPQPHMKVAAIGYGAGNADVAEHPNVLRIFLGESAEKQDAARWDEEVSIIEANLDDMNPQIYGYFVERALGAGALDVYTAAIQMKKNRPGCLLSILCRPADVDRLMDLLFAETTTIGARTYTARRRALPREQTSVETPFGTVRIKLSRMNGHILTASPEYEDCQRIASEQNIPLKRVLSEALLEFEKQRGKTG